MSPMDALAAGLLVGAIVIAYLAFKQRVSWSWAGVAAGTSVLAFLLARLRPRGGTPSGSAPLPPSATHVVTPIVLEADKAAEAAREEVLEANADTDAEERLARLANLNDGGREH